MPRRSLDSETPIMATSVVASKNASLRLSTISSSNSLNSQTSDPGLAEIKRLTNCLSRMENKRLTAQRVVLSEQKSDTMNKLALSAKLERALGRRLVNQDADFKPKQLPIISEKAV